MAFAKLIALDDDYRPLVTADLWRCVDHLAEWVHSHGEWTPGTDGMCGYATYTAAAKAAFAEEDRFYPLNNESPAA